MSRFSFLSACTGIWIPVHSLLLFMAFWPRCSTVGSVLVLVTARHNGEPSRHSEITLSQPGTILNSRSWGHTEKGDVPQNRWFSWWKQPYQSWRWYQCEEAQPTDSIHSVLCLLWSTAKVLNLCLTKTEYDHGVHIQHMEIHRLITINKL